MLEQLRRRPLWLAVGVVVAAIAAASRFAAIGLLPPSVKLRPLGHATASTQLIVGANSSLTHTYHDLYEGYLNSRVATLADMVASPKVRGYIARAAALPASQIAVDAPIWTQLQRIQQWATGEKRANEIVAERDPYRITLTIGESAPIIDVVAQAPTPTIAARLAHGVVDGLRAYVSDIATVARIPPAGRYDIAQLAPVTTAPVDTAGLANVGAFTFLAVFAVWCGLVLLVAGVARDVRAAAIRAEVHSGLGRSSDSDAMRTTRNRKPSLRGLARP